MIFHPMSMKLLSFGFLAALAMGLSGPAHAKPSLDEACARFSSKLESAVASGDSAKAKKIFKEGSKRVADNFNGATCPNIKAP